METSATTLHNTSSMNSVKEWVSAHSKVLLVALAVIAAIAIAYDVIYGGFLKSLFVSVIANPKAAFGLILTGAAICFAVGYMIHRAKLNTPEGRFGYTKDRYQELRKKQEEIQSERVQKGTVETEDKKLKIASESCTIAFLDAKAQALHVYYSFYHLQGPHVTFLGPLTVCPGMHAMNPTLAGNVKDYPL